MPYQTSFDDPYSAAPAAAAYAEITSFTLDLSGPSAVYNISVWRSKADRVGGSDPISTFSRGIDGPALASAISGLIKVVDGEVTAGHIPELAGATVVA